MTFESVRRSWAMLMGAVSVLLDNRLPVLIFAPLTLEQSRQMDHRTTVWDAVGLGIDEFVLADSVDYRRRKQALIDARTAEQRVRYVEAGKATEAAA